VLQRFILKASLLLRVHSVHAHSLRVNDHDEPAAAVLGKWPLIDNARSSSSSHWNTAKSNLKSEVEHRLFGGKLVGEHKPEQCSKSTRCAANPFGLPPCPQLKEGTELEEATPSPSKTYQLTRNRSLLLLPCGLRT